MSEPVRLLPAGSIIVVAAKAFAPDRPGYALLEFGERVRDKLLFRFSSETYETRDAADVAARDGKSGLFSEYAVALSTEQLAQLQADGAEILAGVYGPHRR